MSPESPAEVISLPFVLKVTRNGRLPPRKKINFEVSMEKSPNYERSQFRDHS